MDKIGRNESCPCGCGKKYKRCCANKEHEMRQQELPSGRFRNEPGSYGSPHLEYMPSIICYKETGPESWTEHFILVKSDATLAEEDGATALAENILPPQVESGPRLEETPGNSPCRCARKDIGLYPISGLSAQHSSNSHLVKGYCSSFCSSRIAVFPNTPPEKPAVHLIVNHHDA